jgi:membrane protein YqaA with SNARE-associated domain
VTNFYIDVFKEALLTSSIIPFAQNPTFVAMKSFGNYDMSLAFAFAIAGSAIGIMIGFIIGRLLFRLFAKNINENSDSLEKYESSKNKFSRYFLLLLPFTWLPLLNFLAPACGFFGIRARLALPLMIAGQAAYYGYYLLR